MASAITYGQPDGDRHPNVGALIGTFDRQQYPYCSGTLISPTVFLTAAHCGDDGSTVYVTFDSTPDLKSKLYTGTFYSNPLYPGSQDDPYDIAVVVFDRAIKGIEPAELPTLGQFDSMPKDQQFTAVGYGGQEAVNGPGGPVIGYLDTREYAVFHAQRDRSELPAPLAEPGDRRWRHLLRRLRRPQLPGRGQHGDGNHRRHHDHRRLAVQVDQRDLPPRHRICARLPRRLRSASLKDQTSDNRAVKPGDRLLARAERFTEARGA